MVSKPLLWIFWCTICSPIFSVFSVAFVVDVTIRIVVVVIHWRPLPFQSPPYILLRSFIRWYHWNCLLSIYIIKEESTSSDIPCTFMCRPSKLHQRHAPHVLACVTRRFYFFIHMPHATTRPCAHVPHASHAPMRLTHPTRLTRPTCPTLLQQPANVICDVILLTSTAMAALRLRHHPRHLADVIALLLTFEEGWSLTFSKVKFLQSRCSLSIFLRWFNFVVHFCIFCF